MSDKFPSFEGSDEVFLRKLESLRSIVPDLIVQGKTNPENLAAELHVCSGYSDAQLRREISNLDLNRAQEEADKWTALLREYDHRAL